MWVEHLQKTEHVLIIHVQDGSTALYFASGKGHMKVVQLLLQQKHADVSISQMVYTHHVLMMALPSHLTNTS